MITAQLTRAGTLKNMMAKQVYIVLKANVKHSELFAESYIVADG